jgi:hypothetical protein
VRIQPPARTAGSTGIGVAVGSVVGDGVAVAMRSVGDAAAVGLALVGVAVEADTDARSVGLPDATSELAQPARSWMTNKRIDALRNMSTGY